MSGATQGKKPLTWVLGLTGGLGSGKSTVAHFFQNKGVWVLDAYAILREWLKPNAIAISYVVDIFGEQMLTSEGGLNRDKMRCRLLNSEEDKRALEALLHPELYIYLAHVVAFYRPEHRHWVQSLLSTSCGIAHQALDVLSYPKIRGLVLDIPLLIESIMDFDQHKTNCDYQRLLDCVCVVDSDIPTQIQRVINRNHWPLEQIQQMIRLQLTSAQRRLYADQVIDNGREISLDQLEQRVNDLLDVMNHAL